MAADIPKGDTPGYSYTHFPLPVLRECTDPSTEEAADIRSLWLGATGDVGHVERVEQYGARTVVTSSGIIHDSGPNCTGGFSYNDTRIDLPYHLHLIESWCILSLSQHINGRTPLLGSDGG